MIKIKKYTGNTEVDVYINPAFITKIQPIENELTEVHHFAFIGALGNNVGAFNTLESVESLAKRINNLKE